MTGPLAVMTGVVGGLGSFNISVMEFDAQPFPSTKEIVYDPAERLDIVYGSVVPFAEPLLVPVQDKSPVPEPETVINPVEVPHAVGPD